MATRTEQAELAPVEGLEPTAVTIVETPKPMDRAAVASTNPVAAFLQTALETGKSPDELGKLVDLYERMEQREAEKQFALALAAFQAECPQIIKRRKKEDVSERGNSATYAWANEDDVLQQLRPLLVTHGFSVSYDTEEADGKLTVTNWLHHIGGHKRAARITMPTESRAGMSPQQKQATAVQYGRRYSLIANLGITASDDPTDTENNDPTPIDFVQLEELETLLSESGADPEKFLRFMQVPSLKDVRRVRFAQAKMALEQRIAKNKREEKQ